MDESDDEELPRRSVAHFYRTEGSRAKRFRYESSGSSSDQEHHQEHIDDDEPGPDDVVHELAEENNANVNDIEHDVVNEPNEDNNRQVIDSDSDSDSQWSEDLNEHIVEEDSEPDGDYDPFLQEEEDRDRIVLENHGIPAASSSDESDNEEDNFNFRHQDLSLELNFSQRRTAKESLLLNLALSVRHKLTYECLIQILQNQNFLYGMKYFPSSKKELWKVLGRNHSGVTFYAYCKKCSSLIGKKQNIEEYAVCPECSERTKKAEASYFVSLSVKKQLEHFLALPEAAALLEYRERRVKISPEEEDIEDIFDGAEYKKIFVEGRPLLNSNNYTYVLNTDGFKLKKGGKLNIYPLFLRINELPPGMRQKFMFVAGIFVDRKEPNMVTFLHPFVKQMNRLSSTGLTWKKNGEDVTSRFVPACSCVDGKARSQIYNMAPHNSHYGCTYCTYFGVSSNGQIRYPTQHPDLPPFTERSDAEMREDMLRAHVEGQPVRGHKGFTPLVNLKYLDLAKGNASDDLHSVFECAAVHHTELLIKEVPKLDERMGEKTFFRLIDARLKGMKVPSCIARTAGNNKFQNRKQMHGTDWRNWLWYFGPICLHGLIPDRYIQHLERLSHASYLLSQDIIKPENIQLAEQLILEYLGLYEDYFGIDKTRRNLHELSHAANCVRAWGAFWCYSTFNFESWNYQLMQLVKSAKGALQQMVTRLLIQQILSLMQYSEDIAQDVKDQISDILQKKRYKNAILVGASSYLIGKSIERVPTPEEQRVLEMENVPTDSLRVFDKVLIRGTRYTTARYFLKNEQSRTDDSSIFTHQNTFCTVQNVVQFRTRDGQDASGLLVLEHDLVHRARPMFPFARQICEVQHRVGLLHFISLDKVRAPVVKAPLLDSMFFIPVPNLNEID